MHSAFFVVVAAALSHAYLVSERPEETRRQYRSPFEDRRALDSRNGELFATELESSLEARQDPLFGKLCPSPSSSLSQATVSLPLNMSDLGVVQNAIMSWCDGGAMLNPSVGSNGHVESSNGVQAQICNLQTTPMSCNSSYVEQMFKIIDCGSSSSPTMGR